VVAAETGTGSICDCCGTVEEEEAVLIWAGGWGAVVWGVCMLLFICDAACDP